MTKKLLFIVFTILNISVINATNIKGIITDQKHEAIPFALFSLLLPVFVIFPPLI
jgi:hypothetical protein